MKLSRLLATLALIAAGFAVPTPAVADPVITRPLQPAALINVCAIFTGTYTEGRLSSTCEISDGTIVCAEHCAYQVTWRMPTPPLKEPCELANGTFTDVRIGHGVCALKDGVFTITCPAAELLPGHGPITIQCEPSWAPLDQPMT